MITGTIVVNSFQTIFSFHVVNPADMIYKFSDFLRLNYSQLEIFMNDEEELTKDELLQKCTGEINYEVLQSLKELIFSRIGKTPHGEIYLVQ